MTIPGLKRLVPGIIYINWFHFLNCTYTEYCESTDMAIPSMAASTCTCTCTCAYMYMCISSDFYLIWCAGGYGYVFVAHDTKSGKEYALKVLSYYFMTFCYWLLCGGVAEFAYTLYMNVIGYMNTCSCHVYVYMYVGPYVFPILVSLHWLALCSCYYPSF